MWKGKYYEELKSPETASHLMTTLLDDLSLLKGTTLIKDQINKYSLTEDTAFMLMQNRSIRQMLTTIVDNSNDTDLYELFSFYMAIFDSRSSHLAKGSCIDKFKNALLFREKKYGKNAPQTYTTRKCYIRELSVKNKDGGFKLLRKNFEILIEFPELFPYDQAKEEVSFFLNYYNQKEESKKFEKAYKAYRDYLAQIRRTNPSSTLGRAMENAKI